LRISADIAASKALAEARDTYWRRFALTKLMTDKRLSESVFGGKHAAPLAGARARACPRPYTGLLIGFTQSVTSFGFGST